MNIRNALAGFILLFVVAGGGYFAYRYLVLPSHTCDICGREVSENLKATAVLRNHRSLQACCPRCILHYSMQHPGEMAELRVDDAETGKPLDAQKAFFVEGSDAEGCHSPLEAAPREPGVSFEKKFDRCLPSLIAFEKENVALGFQKKKGGRVLSFNQALESVNSH